MAFEKPDDVKSVVAELIRRANEDRRRIKLIEQDLERIKNSMSSLENAALSQMGDLKLSLDRINNKLETVAGRLDVLDNGLNKLNKDVGKAATKLELKELESFVDIVNPLTSRFVTKDELERAVEDVSSKIKQKVS